MHFGIPQTGPSRRFTILATGASVILAGAVSLLPALASNNAALQGVEGTALTNVDLGSFNDNDFSPQADFIAAITWGDGSGPSAGTVTGDLVDSTLFHVTGTHTYTEASPFAYPIHVDIYDYDGGTVDETFTIDSTATISDAPLTGSPVTINTPDNVAYAGNVATFTDGNPFAGTVDFSGTVDYGDGDADFVSVSGSGGSFTVKGTSPHMFAEDGTYDVVVVINDIDGKSVTIHSPATVTDSDMTTLAKHLSTTEGASWSGAVANWRDPDGGTPTATIDWGDSSPPDSGTLEACGPCVSGDPNGYDIDGTHTYAEEGDYNITVKVTDNAGNPAGNGGLVTTIMSTMHVADAPLGTVTALSFSGTEGMSLTKKVATFTDTDPGGTVSDYTATIHWGDGTTSAGTISNDPTPGVFDVTGTHTYKDECGFPTCGLWVDVADVGGATASSSTNFPTIGDAPLTLTSSSTQVTFTHKKAQSKSLASLKDGNPYATAADFTTGSGSIQVCWGDATSCNTAPGSGFVAISGTGGNFTISGTHNYAKAGVYTITITVHDTGGASKVGTVKAKVS